MTTRRCCPGHLPPTPFVTALLERVARKFARWNGDDVATAVRQVTDAHRGAVKAQGTLPLEGDR